MNQLSTSSAKLFVVPFLHLTCSDLDTEPGGRMSIKWRLMCCISNDSEPNDNDTNDGITSSTNH